MKYIYTQSEKSADIQTINEKIIKMGKANPFRKLLEHKKQRIMQRAVTACY